MALKLLKRAKHFIKDDCGAAMVEYGVALLVVTAVGTVLMTNLGGEVEENVQAACTGLNDNVACATQ
ncbi:MAG: Flp family type IVb pilin [Pseudomonadota bacterium]